MGTWGTGPFDNDSAADFAGGIQDCSGPDARHDLLLATLRAGTDAAGKADLSNEYSFGYELEFGIAAAAFVADEYAGTKKFTDNSYARGVGEDMELEPFVTFHPPSAELTEAARSFVRATTEAMRRSKIEEKWLEPVDAIGLALA